MPNNKHLKSIVFGAAAKVETAIHTYPTHFHDVEKVKEYISTTCQEADLQYITSKQRLTKEELAYIKDKVCFVVACRAFEQGEFYLEVGLVDRAALRAAVEADIQRLLPLVPSWPSRFPGVKEAFLHVDGVARSKNFTYTEFKGVTQDKFRRYVTFNTARHAFEDGRFAMDVPGESWLCHQSKSLAQEKKKKKKKLATAPKKPVGKIPTMKGAIETDVQSLLSRIPTWQPTFSSLNAARDYVADISRCTHFSYTYWPDVAPGRFRLYVNFNTAKRAFGLGKFSICEEQDGDEEEAEEESDDTDETAVERVEVEVEEEKMAGSGLADDMSSSGSTETRAVETHVFPATNNLNGAVDSINTAVAESTAGATIPDLLLPEELSGCISVVREEAQETIMPPVIELDEDPFRDLIAALKRESILKAAFE